MGTSSAPTLGRAPAFLSLLIALVGVATWIAVVVTPLHGQVFPAHVWPAMEFFIGVGAIGFVAGGIAVIRGRILFRLAGVVGALLSVALLVFGVLGVVIAQMFPLGLFFI